MNVEENIVGDYDGPKCIFSSKAEKMINNSCKKGVIVKYGEERNLVHGKCGNDQEYIVDHGQLYYLVTKGCQFIFVNGDLHGDYLFKASSSRIFP
jgi:hypothetical protein